MQTEEVFELERLALLVEHVQQVGDQAEHGPQLEMDVVLALAIVHARRAGLLQLVPRVAGLDPDASVVEIPIDAPQEQAAEDDGLRLGQVPALGPGPCDLAGTGQELPVQAQVLHLAIIGREGRPVHPEIGARRRGLGEEPVGDVAVRGAVGIAVVVVAVGTGQLRLVEALLLQLGPPRNVLGIVVHARHLVLVDVRPVRRGAADAGDGGDVPPGQRNALALHLARSLNFLLFLLCAGVGITATSSSSSVGSSGLCRRWMSCAGIWARDGGATAAARSRLIIFLEDGPGQIFVVARRRLQRELESLELGLGADPEAFVRAEPVAIGVPGLLAALPYHLEDHPPLPELRRGLRLVLYLVVRGEPFGPFGWR